jgi:hypothetical protein
MATYDGGVSVSVGSYTLRLTANEANIQEGNNSSAVSWDLRIIRNSGTSFNLNSNGLSYSVVINGSTVASGSTSYDFRAYSVLVLSTGTTGQIAHNADGSRSVGVSGAISGPGPITGGSAGGTLTLSDFSRPPLAPASCTVSVSGRNATVTSGVADVTNRPAITSYEVERTNNDGVTWSGSVFTMDGSRQYLYSSLDGGKFYKFRTRARNSEGAGAWTESASTFIPAGGRRWTGSTWEPTQIARRWNGSSWVDISTAKRWNGSAWIDLT